MIFHLNILWSFCQRSLLILCCVMWLYYPPQSAAQPVVELIMEPAAQEGTLSVERIRGGVNVFLNITGNWKQLSWQFQGPGRFSATEFGGVYLPPDALPTDAAPVSIAVTAIDPQGRKATDTLEFTLAQPFLSPTPAEPTPTPAATYTPPPTPTATMTPLATPTPEPTATPSPTPLPLTPAPTPTLAPVPQDALSAESHVKKAAEYLEKRQYTTPQGQNAFEEYQAALSIEPDNNAARKGVYDLARKYKYWGDDEYQKQNFQNAKNIYQRYIVVAEYLVSAFDDDAMRKNLEEVQVRLKGME
ncbi:hypothetical protein U14_05220 [Candidatus Moduliflexus flocculans]|uniref:Tetratricopeptide repeat protein n=1 Tax=Candidatus Moduliflexus flocculans TaxID=1499966 RepID=A0A081BRB2_9BACT|nr:hypothetical protein U14_05220 [Candidatus Moduliflexus flocculans]